MIEKEYENVSFEKAKPVLVPDTFNFHTTSVSKEKFTFLQAVGAVSTVAAAGVLTTLSPIGLSTAINTVSYASGIFMAIKGALAMLQHNDSPELVPMSKAITYSVTSSLLISLPTLFEMSN